MNEKLKERADELVEWWKGSIHETKGNYEVLKTQLIHEFLEVEMEGYNEATAMALSKIAAYDMRPQPSAEAERD